MSRQDNNTTQKLEANKSTQEFSAKATIEKHDFRVQDSDFASIDIPKQNITLDFIKSQVTQLCLNKLDKTGTFEIHPIVLKNCQKKALINYSLYY